MMGYLAEYIQKIKDNPGHFCDKIKKLYIGMLEPIVEGKSDRWSYDPAPADKFSEFCRRFIRQTQSPFAGKPLELVDWEKAAFDAFLGIKDRKTGKRRFKTMMTVIGRKNGKTEVMAAYGAYHVLQTSGAEAYCAATSQFQAKKLWGEAVNMITWSKDLSAVMRHHSFPNPDIYVPANKSHFYALSNNPKHQDSLNVSLGLIDEIHELPRDIFDRLDRGTGSRDQPQMIMITTAGYVRGGMFDDEYDSAKKVLSGQVDDPSFLPIIYEVDGDSRDERIEKVLSDEGCWIQANPTLGRIGEPGTVKNVDDLRKAVAKAKYDLNYRNEVMVKDFNIIGVEAKAWLGADDINAGALGPYSIDEIGEEGSSRRSEFLSKFDGSEVIGGYDLSKTGDLTAFDILLFDNSRGCIIVKTMAWCTKSFLSSPECHESRVPWKAWIDRGLVRVSGDYQINYHDVTDYVVDEFNEHRYVFRKIGYDSWSAGYLVDDLAMEGWARNGCQVPVIQGYKTLSLPMQELLAMLKSKKICYLDSPLMKWEMSNAMLVEDRNGNMMIDKSKLKRANKIDNVACLLNAMSLYCEDKDSYLSMPEDKK